MNLVIVLSALLSAGYAVGYPPRLPFLGVKLKPPIARRDAGGVTEGWIEQSLDHNDPTVTATWNQRYFVSTNYYKAGGPAFLFIDGEWEGTGDWLKGGYMVDLAIEHGAIVFELEHRYYGGSRPTENLATENLVYLSSEQALADLAYFIQVMNNQYSLSDAKWIAFGGSYGASLAAWARLKYPLLIHGAVASSAPVLAETNFTGYYEVVGEVIQRASPECYTSVKKASEDLQKLLKTKKGAQKITKIFNLCDPLDITAVDDAYVLQNSYANIFSGTVQYDTYTAQNTATLCQKVTNKTKGATELERYANLNDLSYCQAYTFESVVSYYGSEDWGDSASYRTWFYQTCTEFGYFLTSDSANQPFMGFPVQYYVDICSNLFGDSFNQQRVDQGVSRTNTVYGGLHPDLSNVLFVHGSADPWHVLGVLQDLSSTVQAVVMTDFTHCGDMYSPTDDDPPQLKAAHEKIAQLVKEWVAQ